MKKKIFSTLLMGAFFLASMSMFTSCKDYDDDINAVKNDVEALQKALAQCKTDCETARNNLKTQLEGAMGQLETTLNGKISGLDGRITPLETWYNQVKDQVAKIANLEARIQHLEDVIGDIQNLKAELDKKVDVTTYTEEVAKIYAKIASEDQLLADRLVVLEELKKGLEEGDWSKLAAIADIKQQLEALDIFKKRIEALEAKNIITEDEMTAAIKDAVDKLRTELKNYTDTEIQKLKDNEIKKLQEDLQKLSDRVDKLTAEVNVLNYLIKSSLRSLVFIPEGYYHGVEATCFNYLEAYKFDIPAAAWNVVEKRGFYKDPLEEQVDLESEGPRTDHNRYDSTKVALVEDLWANYHLNPSNVNTDNFTNVSLLTGDKWYENTRSATKADAGLSVKDYKVENGTLKVQIDVEDPEQIKAVVEDYWAEGQDRPMVTVFASQVTLNKAGKDTTVTSDYATLFADKMTGIRLAHVKGIPSFTGQLNTHCGTCPIVDKDYTHLMATVHEAVAIAKNHQDEKVSTNAQDKVNYKETLDLRTLVETHYTTVDSTHKDMTPEMMAKFGLSYKFELTSLHLGNNVTDESAHAAILNDGYTFRPQLPRKIGEKEYAQVDPNAADIADFIGENALQAVGRTPIVRVSLVDKNGNVLDYGYIRIEIVKEEIVPPYECVEVVYNGVDKTYQDVCPRITPKGYDVYETKWIQTEYDIYKNALGIDRETFEEHFNEDPVRDAQQDFQQYEKDAAGNWIARDPADYVGVITNEPDMNDETHTQTSTLKWTLTNADVQKMYDEWDKQTEKVINLTTAVKYEDIHGQNAHYEDVYVAFTTTITFKPYNLNDLKVKVDWSQNKIAKYWYVKNTADMGTDELHTNVPSVEDVLRDDADSLTNLFSNEFLNNEVVNNRIVTGDAGFVYNDYKYRLVFDIANKDKVFKGASGASYTLKLSADQRELLTSTNQSIAKLVLPAKFADKAGDREEANYTMIEYQHSYAAHDLLNYASHKEFNDKNDAVLNDYLNVIITLAVQNDDECKPIKVENGQFNVRFLRPIDVTSKNSVIKDASSSGKQIIYLNGLFDYKDWRNEWKGVNKKIGSRDNYFDYYGIKGIKVPGLTDGDPLSDNHNVKCDLNNDGMKALYLISSQLDFTYHEDATKGNYLEYNNLSSTVQLFELEIPVVIEYIWGEFATTAKVTVDRTQDNAKKF